MRTLYAIVLIVGAVLAAGAAAPTGSALKGKPVTVLQVALYDGTWSVEPVKLANIPWLFQQLQMDYRVMAAADQQARHEWKRVFSAPDKSDWKWVVPDPAPPEVKNVGRFADELDAEDAVDAAKKELEKRFASPPPPEGMDPRAFLLCREENRRLIRHYTGMVRDSQERRDEAAVDKLPEARRAEILDLITKIDRGFMERLQPLLAENGEFDIIALCREQQAALEDIHKKYGLTDYQALLLRKEKGTTTP
ncbi:MAG: hypothetical protein V1809_00365 [Planctomycetota bacterium]